MPNVATPPAPYSLPEWEAQPQTQPKDVHGLPAFEKYEYATGETLDSIAATISLPGQTVTKAEIALLNWGTSADPEVNYYLRDSNGCSANSADTEYVLAETDRQPWLWVPKVDPPVRVGKFRSPGKHDVGHVAPDHDDRPQKHINTLRVPPVYAITLELGDIDAIFHPMDAPANSPTPWTNVGVQQRLQALGYLYTPLAHSQINRHAEACWNYYKRVHDQKFGMLAIHNVPVNQQTAATVQVTNTSIVLTVTGGANDGPSTLLLGDPNNNTLSKLVTAIHALGKGWRAEALRNASAPSPNLVVAPAADANGALNRKVLKASNLSTATLLAILKTEVRNNILTGAFPKSGQVFRTSSLPERGDFAALRFPGCYMNTWPRPEISKPPVPIPGDPDLQFDFTIGSHRDTAELRVKENNPAFGKIPLIARVQRVLPDGRRAPAEGVAVYFQLAEPDPLPSPHWLRPTNLRDTEMDYAKKWMIWERYAGPVDAKTKAPQPIPERLPAVGFPPPFGPPMPTVMPTPADWNLAKQQIATLQAEPDATKEAFIDRVFPLPANANANAALRFLLKKGGSTLNQAPPYSRNGVGPRRWVNQKLADTQNAAETHDRNDPMRRNAPFHTATGATPANAAAKAQQYDSAGRVLIAGNVFEVGTQQAGLHTPRGPHHADYGTLTAAEAATPTGDDHKYAVCARTNDKGIAGVIFMPSRCGGDTFRLRAYIGPETLEFNGADATGPVVETGTLVVWRNARISRYIRHSPSAAALCQSLQDIFAQAQLLAPRMKEETEKQGGRFVKVPKPDITFQQWAMRRCHLNTEAPNLQLMRTDPPEPVYRHLDLVNLVTKSGFRPEDNLNYISLEEQFNRCYCELISDLDTPYTPLSPADLTNLVRVATNAMDQSGVLPVVGVHWDTLFDTDIKSPFLFNMRHYLHYNQLLNAARVAPLTQAAFAAFNPLTTEHVAVIAGESGFGKHSVQPISELFSNGGVEPGITIIQAAYGDTWDHNALEHQAIFSSGWAGGARTMFVFYTDGVHRERMCYSATANTAHEIGHLLMRSHQPPSPSAGDSGQHQTCNNMPGETTPADDDDICVMSYVGSYGEFCGRCVLALRGWRTQRGLYRDQEKFQDQTGIDPGA